METKQFKFTGLNWLDSVKVQKIRKQLEALKNYGIYSELYKKYCYTDSENNMCNTVLTISGYDEVLQSSTDESAVTFIKRNKTEYEVVSDGNDYNTTEDYLLMVTIDEDLEIVASMITFCGTVERIQL